MIDLLKQLISIPRPSRGEDAGADFLEGHLVDFIEKILGELLDALGHVKSSVAG